jgi:hypothetical protein
MSAEAIIIYKEIPGIDGINPKIYRNNQFAQRMDFDIFRRLILKAKLVGWGLYEFTVNGITYHAKMLRNMEPWEKAYYANSQDTCITELMNVYP